MPALHHEEDLSDSTEVVLILRLILDSDARLRRGELLDAGAIRQGRFEDLGGLLDALRAWLGRQRVDCSTTRD